MYRKCVTEVSARHQQQAEQALLTLMGRMAFEDITVTELCREAGLSRRVFYHLFNSKTGALYALLDHVILESAGWGTEIRDQSLRFFCYWKAHSALLDALQSNQLSGLLLERMIGCVLNEDFDIRYWLKEKGWRDEDVIVYHITGTMGLVYRWYYSGFRESPEEMAALLDKIITFPIAPENASK